MIIFNEMFKTHNNTEDPVYKICKEKGISILWDKRGTDYWNEIYSDDQILFQIEQGCTREQFLMLMGGLKQNIEYDGSGIGGSDFWFVLAPNQEGKINEFLNKYF